MSKKLEELREAIDCVDDQLICLLGARFALTRQVGLVKLTEALPATDLDREHTKFAQVAEAAKRADVPQRLATNIMRIVMDEVVQEHLAAREASRAESSIMGGSPDGEFNWLG